MARKFQELRAKLSPARRTRNAKRTTRMLSAEQRARIACATHGHPPIVNVCLGQVTCGRCDAILGDTIMGSYDLTDTVVLDHDAAGTCEVCPAVAARLSRADLSYLPPKARAEIKALWARA